MKNLVWFYGFTPLWVSNIVIYSNPQTFTPRNVCEIEKNIYDTTLNFTSSKKKKKQIYSLDCRELVFNVP
jgi:hypothetical protein